MFELWFLLTLLVPLLWAFANFYDKLIVERITGGGYALVFYSSLSIPFLLLVMYVMFEFSLVINFYHLLLLIISGTLFINGFMLYGKSLEIEESSRVVPLFSLITIFLLFIDIFYFEVLSNFVQISGVLIIILGSLILSSNSFHILELFKPRKVLLYMSALSLILAFHFSIISYFSSLYSIITITYYIFTGSFIGSFGILLLRKAREDVVRVYKKHPFIILLIPIVTNIIDYLNFFLHNFTISIAPSVTFVSAIANMQFVYVFILGIIFSSFLPNYFTEDISKKSLINKGVSVVLIIGGVLLIQLF